MNNQNAEILELLCEIQLLCTLYFDTTISSTSHAPTDAGIANLHGAVATVIGRATARSKGYTMCDSWEFFFFQAEDGIRDLIVTGVQTCALFFSSRRRHTRSDRDWSSDVCSSDLRMEVALPRVEVEERP